MKESTGIEKEISTLHKRREALAVDVRSASRDLEAAREGLVTGPADVAHVTGAQSTFTALDEALAGVDARLTRLRERMEAALVLEQKQAGNTRLREIQEARARVAEKVRLLRSTGDAQLRELASKVLGAMDEWQALGRKARRSSVAFTAKERPVIPFSYTQQLKTSPNYRRLSSGLPLTMR